MNNENQFRKPSEDSEPSTSSRSIILSDAKSQQRDILSLQKKMKILKDAVIRERQEKEVLNKSNHDLTHEVERLRLQVQEKDANCLKLRNENADLHDKLQVLRKKTENYIQQSSSTSDNSITGVIGGLFGQKKGNDEYQKLLLEHKYLKKQMETVVEKLNHSESNNESTRKDYKHQLEAAQKKLMERERELDDKTHAYITITHKNQELTNQYEILQRDKIKVDEEKNRIREELDSTQTERYELERINTDKTKIIDEMNEICQKMAKEIETLKEENAQIQADLDLTELKLQVFNLKKVGKMIETPAQILLRENLAGEHLIEIENAGERVVVYPQLIQSFGPLKESENKFYIEYKPDGKYMQKDTFVTDDRRKVLKSLLTLMNLYKDNRDKFQSKKSTVVDKNVISQVISFFGN